MVTPSESENTSEQDGSKDLNYGETNAGYILEEVDSKDPNADANNKEGIDEQNDNESDTSLTTDGTNENDDIDEEAESEGNSPQMKTMSLPSAGTMSVTTIMNEADLNDIRNDLGGNYVLGTDIDLSGNSNWEPIGDGASVNRFTGTLNGNGYKITGLTINRPTESYVGLFSYIGINAEIKNIKLKDVDVIG